MALGLVMAVWILVIACILAFMLPDSSTQPDSDFEKFIKNELPTTLAKAEWMVREIDAAPPVRSEYYGSVHASTTPFAPSGPFPKNSEVFPAQ